MRKIFTLVLGFVVVVFGVSGLMAQPGQPQPSQSEEEQLLSALHSISSHTLYDYVKELVSEKYGGGPTGTGE